MSRILLIARREYGAYARTVGFWLSLLAFAAIVALLLVYLRRTRP